MSADALAWWRNNESLAHIVPPGTGNGPEGFDICEALHEFVSPHETVLDFGCGVGRLTRCFAPDRYVGVDVNLSALLRAEEHHPEHHYEYVQDELPRADVALAYTVLLHVPDDALDGVITRLARAVRRVLVVEILGRKWRRDGVPATFNRTLDDYAAAFAGHGMHLLGHKGYPYLRYGGVNITAMDFER